MQLEVRTHVAVEGEKCNAPLQYLRHTPSRCGSQILFVFIPIKRELTLQGMSVV